MKQARKRFTGHLVIFKGLFLSYRNKNKFLAKQKKQDMNLFLNIKVFTFLQSDKKLGTMEFS